MQFYKERLLSATQLKRLSDHKYSCTSASLVDPILQPWWIWLVSKTPLWLAPNLITILGLIVNVITTLILVWYSPDAKQEAPRWACALCAVGVFIYQSLDAIDGKQARRTGSSSPLGELFDHGCDSISTVFIALSACISVQLGQYPTWMFFQCFCAMTLFYCAHWQTYVSGTLKLGKVDVTEAQLTIVGIHLISAIFTPSIWSLQIVPSFESRYLIGLITVMGAGFTLADLFSVILAGGVGKNGSTVAMPIMTCRWCMAVCLVFFTGYMQVFFEFCCLFREKGVGKNGSTVAIPILNTPVSIVSNYFVFLLYMYLGFGYAVVIFTGGVGKNGSTVAGTSILSPVIPFSLVVIPAFIIYQKSESMLYQNHPSLYILAFGMVCAKVTNKLVVAHMTKSEMEYLDWSMFGPAMLFMNQYFNTALPEYYVLWLCLIWVTVDLIRYCGQICLEICDHLHIHLFRIPYPPPVIRNAPSQTVLSNVASHTDRNELSSVFVSAFLKIASKYNIEDFDSDDVEPLIQ